MRASSPALPGELVDRGLRLGEAVAELVRDHRARACERGAVVDGPRGLRRCPRGCRAPRSSRSTCRPSRGPSRCRAPRRSASCRRIARIWKPANTPPPITTIADQDPQRDLQLASGPCACRSLVAGVLAESIGASIRGSRHLRRRMLERHQREERRDRASRGRAVGSFAAATERGSGPCGIGRAPARRVAARLGWPTAARRRRLRRRDASSGGARSACARRGCAAAGSAAPSDGGDGSVLLARGLRRRKPCCGGGGGWCTAATVGSAAASGPRGGCGARRWRHRRRGRIECGCRGERLRRGMSSGPDGIAPRCATAVPPGLRAAPAPRCGPSICPGLGCVRRSRGGLVDLETSCRRRSSRSIVGVRFSTAGSFALACRPSADFATAPRGRRRASDARLRRGVLATGGAARSSKSSIVVDLDALELGIDLDGARLVADREHVGRRRRIAVQRQSSASRSRPRCDDRRGAPGDDSDVGCV